jgi:hypothetical protein
MLYHSRHMNTDRSTIKFIRIYIATFFYKVIDHAFKSNISSVTLAIEAHKAELAKVRAMPENTSDSVFTITTESELAALKHVARIQCGSENDLAHKLHYLVGLSKADDGEDGLLVAIRTAAESWLKERALAVA